VSRARVSGARCQYGSVVLVKISWTLSPPRSLWSVPELTEPEAQVPNEDWTLKEDWDWLGEW